MQHSIGFYIRVSTDEQAMRVDGSLENQKHRLVAEVKRKNESEPGWGKVIEIYQDDGFSAKDTNRPAYQRMMKDIRNGKIDLILVSEFSRLSRNMLHFCLAMEDLKKVGASVMSIKENFDTSTSVGHMMVMNMINLAQFEREQVAERVSLNFHSRALRGLRNGGQPLLGYDTSEENAGVLKTNEKEAEDVRTVFQLFLEEESVARTAIRLKTLPITPKSVNKDFCRHNKNGVWQSRTVLNLLRNPAYIGIREINVVNKDKGQLRLKANQKYMRVKASWPAIVDEATFNSVQLVLDENLKANRARLGASEERIFLLSGLLSCGECGRALVGSSAHGKTNVHRYYIHRPIEGEKVACSIKTIKAGDIEQKILEHLDLRLTSDGYLEQLGNRVVEMKKTESKDESSELDRRQKELEQVNRDIDATFRMLGAQGTTDGVVEVARQKLDEYTTTKKQTEARIEELKYQIEVGVSAVKEMELVQESLMDFRRLHKNGNRKGLKRLIRKVFAGIRVERERLGLFYWTASEAAIIGFESETKKATGSKPVASNLKNDGQILPFRQPTAPTSWDNKVEIMQFRKIGRDDPKALESAHLIDYVNINFLEIGENTKKLQVLRVEKQLSMRELATSTGHSRSYLRQQLRKFGIASEKSTPRLAPFGWDWKGNELVQNAKEQPILCEILELRKVGKGCKSIASDLNRRGVLSKTGGQWWPSSVKNILNRESSDRLKKSP